MNTAERTFQDALEEATEARRRKMQADELERLKRSNAELLETLKFCLPQLVGFGYQKARAVIARAEEGKP